MHGDTAVAVNPEDELVQAPYRKTLMPASGQQGDPADAG
jgi:valyl-tRNA synthetase